MNFKLNTCLVSLSLGLLLFVGCKKDSTSPTVKMAATIDGAAWNAGLRVTLKKSDGFYITGTQISSSLATSSIVIKIFGLAAGTYNVIATSNNCAAVY
jgi:hypothetical protein